jgi:hypothetical protein
VSLVPGTSGTTSAGLRIGGRHREALVDLGKRLVDLGGNRAPVGGDYSCMDPEPAVPFPVVTPDDAVVPDGRRLSARKFVLHFLEMVIAMVVGMMVLHPVWMFGLDAFGAADVLGNPYTGSLIMATNMTVAMSAWMRFRGHRPRPIAEMAAVMYVPFLVLFVPLALGLVDAGAVMLWGHLLMLPAMVGVMLLRPHEYAGC